MPISLFRNGLLKVNLQLLAEEGSGGGDGGSSGGEGNNNPSSTFTQADIDKAVQQAIKTREKNIRTQIETEFAEKTRLEKLTAEEQVAEQKKGLEAEKKAIQIDRNKAKAERLIASAGLDDETATTLLESLVSEDEDGSLAKVQKVIKTLTDKADAIAKAKIQEAMKDVKPPPNGGGDGKEIPQDVAIARDLGKARSEQNKQANDILNKYLGG